MSNVIRNESGKTWDGEKFGDRARQLTNMDELNNEMGKIKESGFRGKATVVQDGAVTMENPILEVEI